MGGDGGFVDDALDDVADEVGHAKHHELVGGAFHRDGVGDDELVHDGLLEFVEGVAREECMGAHYVNLLGSVLFDAGGSFADGAAGIDDIIKEDDVLPFHIADNLEVGDFIGFHALFEADGEVTVEHFGEHRGTFGAAGVGGDDAKIVPVEASDIGEKYGRGEKVIHRDFEESLDLVGVQVHSDEAVDAGSSQKVGHQFGADGGSRFVFTVLARVAEVGDHRDDFGGGGAFGGVNQNKELKDVFGRGESGLDDENVAATDGFVVVGLDFTVFELHDFLVQKVQA